MLLSDGYLANGSEPWRFPTADELPDISVPFATEKNHVNDDGTEEFWPYQRDPETLARPWAIPGTPGLMHRVGGIEKQDGRGDIDYSPANHEKMVHLLAELRTDAVARLSRTGNPSERIRAIIDACFGDSQFDEQVFSAWLALYGNARHSAKLQRILLIYHARLRSNLVHDLKKLVGHERAPGIADGIAAMIDGLWLRYALTGKPSHVEEPRTLTRAYLWAVLGRDRVAPSRN